MACMCIESGGEGERTERNRAVQTCAAVLEVVGINSSLRFFTIQFSYTAAYSHENFNTKETIIMLT